MTNVTKHAVVTWIHPTNRAPAHFTFLVTFVGGRSFTDALVDEDEVGVLLLKFRHCSLASINVFLTYVDGCTTISFVVEVIIILVSNVITNLIEESVEVEELREVFLCNFATVLSKTQIVGLSV